MIRVKFNNSKTMRNAEFQLLSGDIVQLSGDKINANQSGFKVFRLNGDLLGDYAEYQTIIHDVPGCVQFSKTV